MYTLQNNTVWYMQSVPNTCPIPKNAVALIGGNLGPPAKYLLYKDGQEITIVAPNYDCTAGVALDDEFFEWKVTLKIKQTYGHYLEIIQAQLEDIEFGYTSYAYLLANNFGSGFYIRPYKMEIPSMITCPLWARTILEDEIQFTVWGQAWDRRGIWDGQEVDVFYAWEETNMKQLDNAMKAYRALQDMDLAFEFYGHLMRNGVVIGFVSQAAKGRLIRESDRPLVYRTISDLQCRGFLYRGCWMNRFLVSPEGKLRLTEVFSLSLYPPSEREELDSKANVFHWQELSELFNEIKTYGPFGFNKHPPDRLTASAGDLQLVTPPANPERPLGGIFLYHSTNFFITYDINIWKDFILVKQAANDYRTATQRRPREAVDTYSSYNSSSSEVDDRPLTVARLSIYRGRAASNTRHQTSLSYRRLRIAASPGSDITDNSDITQLNSDLVVPGPRSRDASHPYTYRRLRRMIRVPTASELGVADVDNE